jgi:pyruvate formate lyase activating enzyme
MITCSKCNKNPSAEIIGYCAECIRKGTYDKDFSSIHSAVRKKFNLPAMPLKSEQGISCDQCANNCKLKPGETGYCGMRSNKSGRIINRAPKNSSLAHMYLDLLPTNCCASWFCEGSKKSGYNLAVFFYGCNFNCLFCQNSSHKSLNTASIITEDEMVKAALDPSVRCVCFFGGSPEPQLPFSIKVAQRIIKESGNRKHICWEWNGCGNIKLVKKVAELAVISGGTVKFDLKAWHPNIVKFLCGVNNKKAFDNFACLAKNYPAESFLTATTLLVPFYVDYKEIDKIASFIAQINTRIPYSLLLFHPDFYLDDLPVTPKSQVEKCYNTASKYLEHVNIGNKHLLYA